MCGYSMDPPGQDNEPPLEEQTRRAGENPVTQVAKVILVLEGRLTC